MPRKLDHLFEGIASFRALVVAAKRAVKGKRAKPGAAAFMANLEREALALEREMRSGSYRPGRYVTIDINEPKPRVVSAAPFRDRVVHHAVCAVVAPIFERGFVFDCYANRAGKGTHRAVDRYERFRARYAHVLRCDIYRYFPAIDHAVLKLDLRRRLACRRTLGLLDRIIDGSNPQEPVEIHYPGDGLFTPFERRRGLPIGNLTSQFFANVYLNGLDHFCQEVLRARGYVRYVDDFALFHDDPAVLADWRMRIEGYLVDRRLSLHPRKTYIAKTSEPTEFLGYGLFNDGRRQLPESNLRRFRSRLRSLRDRYRAGRVTLAEVDQRIRAWIAHAEHAKTWRLRHAIFQGGRFDPARKTDRPAGGCSGAARGTTNRETCVPRIATGTAPTTGTTTTGSGWPVRPQAGAGALKGASGVHEGVQGRSL